MPARRNDPDTRHAFDWSELEAAYGGEALTKLIERAHEQLLADLVEFDRMLDARLYANASQRLHRMKGTASFFTCDEDALAALHAAEKALALAEPELIGATLPRARRAIETLARAFEVRLAQG